MDNDKADQETLKRIEVINPNTGNYSHIYEGYKDFNEYLTITNARAAVNG